MQGSEQLGRRVKIEYATGGRRNNPSFRDDRDRDRDRDHGRYFLIFKLLINYYIVL